MVKVRGGTGKKLTVVAVMFSTLLWLMAAAQPALAGGPADKHIGGTVFFDHQGNGKQDADDEGLAGMVINLKGPMGVISTTTDAKGAYTFSGLAAGKYTVKANPGAGFVTTTPGKVNIELKPGEQEDTATFGAAIPEVLYGAVFLDANRNGQFDYFEQGINHVGLNLYADLDGNGRLDSNLVSRNDPVARTRTDSQGNFLFTGLAPGNYILVEQDPDHFGSTTPNIVPVVLVSNDASGGVSVNFGDISAR